MSPALEALPGICWYPGCTAPRARGLAFAFIKIPLCTAHRPPAPRSLLDAALERRDGPALASTGSVSERAEARAEQFERAWDRAHPRDVGGFC